MLAFDLVERVAHGAEEILVRSDNGAVEIELDYSLRPADGVDHALCIGGEFAQLGDVVPLEDVAIMDAVPVIGGGHA